jgi:hypothetical protein
VEDEAAIHIQALEDSLLRNVFHRPFSITTGPLPVEQRPAPFFCPAGASPPCARYTSGLPTKDTNPEHGNRNVYRKMGKLSSFYMAPSRIQYAGVSVSGLVPTRPNRVSLFTHEDDREHVSHQPHTHRHSGVLCSRNLRKETGSWGLVRSQNK